jgi:siderophore synthetase component
VFEEVGADLGEYLALLFGWHVTLWLRYGVVLESHQQNVSLVLDGGPLRLLYKDNDGPRIDHARLAAALGPDAPRPADFADRRILAAGPEELADVFTTITVHLCAGALAFGLASRGLVDRDAVLALLRNRLEAALAGHPGAPAADTLRRRVLDADRLPVKTMVTAGTLLPKHRTGAADVNKHYGTTGPNYLLPRHRRSR